LSETLVLGLGNPLRGDDGVGPAVIEWLRQRGLPPGVVAVDGGTPGLDLVLMLEGRRRAIIVDTAAMGRVAGEWARFALDAAQLRRNRSVLSLHGAGVADALELSAALGQLPEEVVVFGVQPAHLDWSPGLSVAAQAAVPEVGRAVLREIANDH